MILVRYLSAKDTKSHEKDEKSLFRILSKNNDMMRVYANYAKLEK